MEKQFEILRANRLLILKIIENLTLAQLNKIPNGFKNNIAWNVAHLIVTQQLLCYKLAGLNILVTEEMVETFQNGTSPNRDVTQDELDTIKEQLLALPNTFEEDYSAKIFNNYKPYHPTSVNVTLNNINEAFEFNNFHEGIHLGIILSLKKFV